MAEFPALPIFTDAYLGDTRHLTAAQHGAYLLLLMTAWRSKDCSLPDDDEFLARCASMDIRTWKINKPVVMAFWRKDALQKFRQGRLEDERKYAEDIREKNSQAGKASALKRKGRHSTTVLTDVPTTVPTKTQPPTHTLPTPLKLATEIDKKENKINAHKIFTHDECNAAKKGTPAWNPDLTDGEVLPNGWHDIANSLKVPDAAIYKSWTKFKETTGSPFDRSRWQAWIRRENGAHAEAAT